MVGEKRAKHSWTIFEDAKLVESLVEMVKDGGWRSDNGTFKPGYAQHLHGMLREKLPSCTIESTTTINCKVKNLKKWYIAISEMLGSDCNEFRWNDEFKCVVAKKEVFDTWVMSHPNAKGLRNKSFPYYDELTFVFGKDRTTKVCSETASNMASNDGKTLGTKVQMGGFQKNNVSTPPPIDTTANAYKEDKSVTSTNRQTLKGGMSRRRKRKRTSYDSEMLDILYMVMDMQASQLERMASRPESKYAMESGRRKETSKIIDKLPELSMEDKFKLMDIIFPNADMMDNFLSLPMELKTTYCMNLLGRVE